LSNYTQENYTGVREMG